ncbi:hypothetical protein ACHAQH_009555 [Verticillium albo-atrum]
MDGLAISPFVASLPKLELHVHIEGTLLTSLRWSLAAKNKIPLLYPTYEALLASYAVSLTHRPELTGRTPGIPTFLEAFAAGCEVLFPKVRKLVDRGVKVCINSDDPVYMHDVWVDGNMQKVYTYCGMSKLEMVQLARNGVDMAWASDEVKKELYHGLDAVKVNNE